MKPIEQTLADIRHRINQACARAQRLPDSVVLLPVSKKQPLAMLEQAFNVGLRAFGENYVQEGLEKMTRLSEWRDQLQWHLIGPLQSNKTREVAQNFDWVHTIDRIKIAQRLSEQRPPHLHPLQVCIQVNVSCEQTKSGVKPEDTLALAQAIVALPRLQLRGLMSIPQASAEPERLRTSHRALRCLLEHIRASLVMTQMQTGYEFLDTLSMGMSADLEVAIEEGSTLVRVGTALFGERP